MLCGALETLADVKLAETKILGSTGLSGRRWSIGIIGGDFEIVQDMLGRGRGSSVWGCEGRQEGISGTGLYTILRAQEK